MDDPSLLKRCVHGFCGVLAGGFAGVLLAWQVPVESGKGILGCAAIGALLLGSLAFVFTDEAWKSLFRW